MFLVLAISFGTAIALIVPPYQVPDEQDHFLHAYQISEGHFVAKWEKNLGRSELPLSIYQTTEPFAAVRYNTATTSLSAIRRVMRVTLQPQVRVNYVLETAHYSPLPYLPQAIGVGIGRIFRWPPLVLLYLGRLANVWVWAGLGYLTLRIAPGLNRALMLLMLMPMSLFMAASVSPDASVNALAFLVVALGFAATVKKQNEENSFIGWPWVAAFIASTAALSQAKAAYLPLAGLIFIPAARLGPPKRFAIILLILAFANVIPLLVWSHQTPGLDTVTYMDNPFISARRQLEFLVGHPQTLLTLPFSSARQHGLSIVLSLVGRLGWFNIQVSPIFVFVYLAALVFACRAGIDDPEFSKVRRVILVTAAAIVASTEMLLLLIYLIWTPVGGPSVDGLQGRYFIPIAAAMLLLLSALWRALPARFQSHSSASRRNVITVLLALASCVYTIIIIYLHYYVSFGVGFI